MNAYAEALLLRQQQAAAVTVRRQRDLRRDRPATLTMQDGGLPYPTAQRGATGLNTRLKVVLKTSSGRDVLLA